MRTRSTSPSNRSRLRRKLRRRRRWLPRVPYRQQPTTPQHRPRGTAARRLLPLSPSREPPSVSQDALVPAHTKAVFLGDIAKYEGQTVTDFFAVAQKQFSRKRDGAVYLSLRLTDRTGQCEAKMWDNFEACAETFQASDIVKVQVEVSGYNGRPQLTIKKLRKAEDSEYSLADFQPHK